MNQSFFKEILEQEIHSVFLTPAEFGESVKYFPIFFVLRAAFMNIRI